MKVSNALRIAFAYLEQVLSQVVNRLSLFYLGLIESSLQFLTELSLGVELFSQLGIALGHLLVLLLQTILKLFQLLSEAFAVLPN